MKAEAARLQPTTLKAGDLGWICRSMVLSWRSSNDEADAARLFAEIFGSEATRAHRNKFPTASMPCRSWATGLSDGIAVDLRIGVDNHYSRLRLLRTAENELMRSDLALFRSCIDRLETAACVSLADSHAMLDLELPRRADHEGFMRWLGHEDWQSHALLLKFEYLFAARGGSTEVSVTASFDRRSEQLGLVVGVTAPPGQPSLASSEIFRTLDGLFATGQLADIAAL